jgi:polar amino acid transport system substrate-binding protein
MHQLLTTTTKRPRRARLGLRLGTCLVGLGALFSANAQGANPMCPPEPIRYAHYEFGLLYTPESGGIDEDIRRELERRTGCKFIVDLRPRARIWRDLESGDVDMAGSGVQTPAREAYAWFAHYVIERNVVALSERVPASVHSFDDFTKHTQLNVGVVRSFSFGTALDTHVDRLRASNRVYEVSDTRTLYRMFDFQRYDAFIGSQFLHAHYFKSLKLPLPKRFARWDPEGGVQSGLVLAKKRFSPTQAQAWQGMVQDMLRDGTVQRIVARYLGKEAEDSVVRTAPPKRATP